MIKNNKGFTLVEMIGIIVLLTVIMIVVAPSMISTLKGTNTKRYNDFKDNLKIAVENYIVDNKISITSGSNETVKLGVLLENKYIEEIPSIPSDDPLADDGNTELTENSYVIVSKGTPAYTYKLCKTDSSCENI